MEKTLFHSIIVNQRCNLACEYCDSRSHKFISRLDAISDKGKSFIATVEKYNTMFSARVMELIGGGELFLEKGIDRWVEPVAKYYDHIEIVTNGLNIPFDEIRNVNSMASFSLAVSLDGHTYDMCKARFRTEKQFETVFNNVLRVLESGIYLELRAVLHRDNAEGILEFIEFLHPYRDRVALQISPVKDKIPNTTSRQEFDEVYINCTDNIIKNHDRYKEYIAPLEYFKALREFFMSKVKPTRCFIPYFKMLSLIDGSQAACSVNWIKELPGLFNMESSDNYFEQDIFKLMCRKKPVLSTCVHDFGDSDIYNLYMLDRIELDELSYFKLYTRPRVKERMKELKERYMLKSHETPLKSEK